MSEFKQYKRKGLSEMRPYVLNEDLTGISVNPVDCPPADMGMVARNPLNHKDKWYVARKYFEDNLELVDAPLQGAANTVSQEDVNNFIGSVAVNTLPDGKTTTVQATLKNGFTLFEHSSCVDPDNYDEVIGADICLKKIEDEVWYLLGFLLQHKVTDFKVVRNG